MTLFSAALLLAIALLTLSRWTSPRVRSRLRVGAAVLTIGLCAGLMLVQGFRWQLTPFWLAAASAWAVTLIDRPGDGPDTLSRARGLLVVLAAGSAVTLGLVGCAAVWAFPRLELPEPTGPYEVGTSTMQLTDRDRGENATRQQDDRRVVVVQTWYPTNATRGERSRYLGRTGNEARDVAQGAAAQFGLPSFLLSEAVDGRSHAIVDAAPARVNRGFPLVIFSPGLGGVRTQNTVWAEELASHGYVVSGVDHPYDSAVVVVDGRPIRSLLRTTGDDDEDNRRADRSSTTRAADLSFVLTALERMNAGEIESPFRGVLDLDRVAAAGHSLGGASALTAARDDRRFDAIINLDGLPRNSQEQPFPQPLLALVADDTYAESTGSTYRDRLDGVLRLSEAKSYRLEVRGAAHLSFTDAGLYLPPLPFLIGSLGRAEGSRVTAESSRLFLDAVLKSSPGGIERRLAEFGDLTSYPR